MSIKQGTIGVLEFISFWALIAALATCGTIIIGAMAKGMLEDRAEKAKEKEITA